MLFLKILELLAAGCIGLPAQSTVGGAAPSEQLLPDRACITCHTTNGRGGIGAPDLARRGSRNYTPISLASAMWNDAQSMSFGSKESPTVTLPENENQALDLFAFFAARRYFEPLGDAARGKRVFVAKGCASCHGVRERSSENASSAVAWHSLRDPVAFAQAMWNHAPTMIKAYSQQGIRYPQFTPPELNDLLVYLENLPEIRREEPHSHLENPETGRTLIQVKGCVTAACHGERFALQRRETPASMAELSAAMWNHTPATMKARPPLSYQEMSSLVSYLWFAGAAGDPSRGERAFVKKNCARCHGELHDLSPFTVVTALWNHGAAMQADIHHQGLHWPHVSSTQFADMAAYFESLTHGQ